MTERLEVSLIAFSVDWTDERNRERFVADSCDECGADLDSLPRVEVFPAKSANNRLVELIVLCSSECREQAIINHKARIGEYAGE